MLAVSGHRRYPSPVSRDIPAAAVAEQPVGARSDFFAVPAGYFSSPVPEPTTAVPLVIGMAKLFAQMRAAL